jgi:DNA polymerase-3 subunit gamma/tau
VSSGPSLYRRHRPRSFADVVGQEHVVRTLSNAVERGKVHHAYLFVGSRGTGKTSMAKILAACLNCERGGPTITPCGECDSCVSIASATSLDVIEMDAASNNSVDDIRDLRDKVGFAPVSGRHKVYILDEAHMLSSQAWNAFLKTLEEPPPNTIFVLATTEAQKVLPTVVDRCHRFDFGRPSVEQIARVLRRVADQESIDVPDAALGLVARAATGSFRDALGTLEQLVTYAGTGEEATPAIALDDVLAVLGVASADLLFASVDAVAERDPRAGLLAAADLAHSGRDPGQFLRDLEAHARELLIVQTLGEVPSELRLTAEHDERLTEQAARLGRADVVRVLDLVSSALEAIRDGAEARIQLELALVKAAAPEVDPSVRALLARIDHLESRLAGAPPPPAPSPSAPPAPAPASPGPRTESPAPRSAAAPSPGPAAPVPAAATAVALAPAPDPVADEGPVLDLAGFTAVWPAVLEALKVETPMLAALLAGAAPVALGSSEVTLAFPRESAFLKRQAEGDAHRAAAADAIRAVTGRSLRPLYDLRDEIETGSAPIEIPRLTEEELVARLMAEFDAEEIPSSDEEAGT